MARIGRGFPSHVMIRRLRVLNPSLYTVSVSGAVAPSGVLSKQTAKRLPSALKLAQPNLLTPNQATAETDTTGVGAFQTGATPTVTRDTSRSFQGAASFKAVMASGGSGDMLLGFDVGVPTVSTYTFSTRITASSVSSMDLDIAIQWYDVTDTVFLGQVALGRQTNPGSTWTRYSVTGAAPPGTERVRCWAIMKGTTSAQNIAVGDALWIDGSVLEFGNLLTPDVVSLITQAVKVLSLSGATTPAGALQRQANKVLVGTVTSSGSLVRLAQRRLTGTVTSAGALVQRINKALAGTLTSAGSLATVKVAVKSLSGTLTSAGVLTRQAQRTLVGSLSSAGALVRQANKVLSSAIAPAGALTPTKIAGGGSLQTLSLSGTLTSAGSVLRQTNKVLTGTMTSTGSVSRLSKRLLTGVLTPSGLAIRQANRTLVGTLTSSGTVTRIKVAVLALSGTLTSTGTVVRLTQRVLFGAVSPVGQIIKLAKRTLSGAVAPTGRMGRGFFLRFSGTIAPSGSVSTLSILVGALVGHVTRVLASGRSTAFSLASRTLSFVLPPKEDR